MNTLWSWTFFFFWGKIKVPEWKPEWHLERDSLNFGCFIVQRYHSLFKHSLIRCISLLFQALLQWVTLSTCHFLCVLVHVSPIPRTVLSGAGSKHNCYFMLQLTLLPCHRQRVSSLPAQFLLSLPVEHIAKLWKFANLVGLKKKVSKSVWFSCVFFWIRLTLISICIYNSCDFFVASTFSWLHHSGG